MNQFQSDPSVYAFIGHAMAVHRELGPGVNEVFYHSLLSERLTAAGIEHLSKPRRALLHRGRTADIFEPDLVLPGKLIPELKALWGDFEREHFIQLKAYLKCWQIRQGLLCDFGKESLMTRSYLYDDTPAATIDIAGLLAGAPAGYNNAVGQNLCASLVRIAASYGFGYRDTTYRGLLVADLMAEGIGCVPAPPAAVRADGRVLGESLLPCVTVADACAVLVLSQREAIRAADRAILQTCLRLLQMPCGLIAHFGKQQLQVQWVGASNRA